jgi:hypothetical protein
MGARRGKPLSRQAGAPANQEPLVPGAQPVAPEKQPYGAAIYGPENIYTGYVRSPFGSIRSRRPLSEKSRQSVESIFNVLSPSDR